MKIPWRLLGVLLAAFAGRLWGQEDREKLSLNGYLKFLHTNSHFNQDFLPPQSPLAVPSRFQDYQLHNRIDLRYRPGGAWELGLGMRNRLFWGYQVRENPAFAPGLDEDPGLVDLSFLYGQSDAVLLHSIFDRAWLQWEDAHWRMRLGRQRINWGVNTVWNPHDILNQYNYFDFDYEERPGVDALRLQFFPTFLSQWELAVAPATNLRQSVAGLLYKNNRFSYDFQIMLGYYRQDLVAGGAWAGSIGGLGFLGEFSYYRSLFTAGRETWLISPALDYVLASGLYLQLSYLYNQSAPEESGLDGFLDLNQDNVLSPRDLFPFQHTLFFNASYPFTPLFSFSLATMANPDGKNLILFPTLSYNLLTNLDILLALQLFATENPWENNHLQWLSGQSFMRLKYSF